MGKIESALLNYDLNSNFTHNELNQAHEKINKNVSKEKTMQNEFDYQILVIFEQLRDMLEDIDLSNNKVFNLPRETAEFYLKEQNKFAVSELLKLISKLAKNLDTMVEESENASDLEKALSEFIKEKEKTYKTFMNHIMYGQNTEYYNIKLDETESLSQIISIRDMLILLYEYLKSTKYMTDNIKNKLEIKYKKGR